MNRIAKLAPFLALAALTAANVARAQAPPPTPTPASPDAGSATRSSTAAGTQLLTGTVWTYRPGQAISIKTGDGKMYDMALEPNVRVDGSVREGQLASLMWLTDNNGKTRVMSITAAPGNAMDIERSAPSVPSPTPRPSPVPRPTPTASR